MGVITISRQNGSEGRRVAEAVAREMGFALADKTTIEAILGHYGLLEPDERLQGEFSIWDLFDKQYVLAVDLLNRTILALAQRGDVVILGRGGYAPLIRCGDVLNVRVKAPLEIRAARIAEYKGVTGSQAKMAVRKEDRQRRSFVESVYRVRSTDMDPFDLVVDTGTLTVEGAARLVCAAAKERFACHRGETQLPSAFEVEPVLRKSIDHQLA